MASRPASRRRLNGGGGRKLTVVGAVLVIAVAAAGGAYIYYGHSKAVAAVSQKKLKELTQQFAGAVAKPFADINTKLRAVGRAGDVVAAFKAGDKSALTAAARAHQGEFPDALELRLFLPGKYPQDSGSTLTFASLEMLRRAEQSSDPISTEVDLFGSPDQHITMVQQAVDRGGQLIGLLHLSLNVSMLDSLVKRLDAGGGYLELVQDSGDHALVLAAAGNKSAAAGAPVRASVPDTRWNLRFWPAGLPVSAGGPPLLWVILPALLLALIAAMGWYLAKRRGAGAAAAATAAAPGPHVVYAGAVKAIMEGAHPGMEQLVPNLPQYGQKAPIQPVSRGMVGEDITMIMNKKDLQGETGDMLNISPASERRDQASPAPKPKPKPKPKTEKHAPPPQTPIQESAPGMAGGTGQETAAEVSPEIFRAYDIRGVVGKTLTGDTVEKIGRALGSEAAARSQKVMVIARDGRKSSPELAESLARGLTAAGVDVIDIGMVPTPLLYFATHELGVPSGVMVTGSHNGPEYNGLKIVLAGETLSEGALRAVYDRIRDNDVTSGSGSVSTRDTVADYVRRIAEDIPVALGNSYKIVVDCGNGVAGVVAPQLLRALGHDVIELYCDVDGAFPNHHPDPSQPENLAALIDKVKAEQADLGLAFDGDGDRLGVVDGGGNIIWPDRQLMLLARDVLSRNAGATILFDVKCSRYLRAIIESSGGKPLMCRTGHSLIKAKMKEVGAPLAGEMSGHIFFKERWYGFDDALYTAARMLEVLMKSGEPPAEVFAELPQGVSTPELRIVLPESAHRDFMDVLKERMTFDGAEIIDIDGYRVEFPDGWGLIRPSNTSPALILRFEAESREVLERIQEQFRTLLLSIKPDLKLPF